MHYLERVYKELYFESSGLEFQIIIRNSIIRGAFVVDEFQWDVGVAVQECFIFVGLDQFRIVFDFNSQCIFNTKSTSSSS